MKRIFTFLLSLVITYGGISQNNFTDGIFVLNEDWFGHNNSTINFIHAGGEIFYRVFSSANAGKSFGCTAQYGTIYGGKLIVMAKQDQDTGDNRRGGRVTIADALSLKMLEQYPMLEQNPVTGKSMADGRGCVGVDEHTAYLGSSNGIYLLNLNTLEIGQKISGTENPLITGHETNEDGTGALYNNQIGMMIRGTDYVFAIYQDRGILVIDPNKHEIVREIPGCFGTMTLSKEGYIWANQNMNMAYQRYPYGFSGSEWKGTRLKKINQHTLAEEDIAIPEPYAIGQSWFAWTAGVLCASKQQNALYWVENDSWFNGGRADKIYKYDIDRGEISLFYDLEAEKGSDFAIYAGAGIGINPLDDKMYVFVQKGGVSSGEFYVYKLNHEGRVEAEMEFIRHWWYPAMLISPDTHLPKIAPSFPVQVTLDDKQPIHKLFLGNKISDADNFDGSIIKSVQNISDPAVLSAVVKHDTLILSSPQRLSGSAVVTLKFNSNGQTVMQDLAVEVDFGTAGLGQTEDAEVGMILSPNPASDNIRLNTHGNVEIYNVNGIAVYRNTSYSNGSQIDISHLPKGVYVVKAQRKSLKLIKK